MAPEVAQCRRLLLRSICRFAPPPSNFRLCFHLLLAGILLSDAVSFRRWPLSSWLLNCLLAFHWAISASDAGVDSQQLYPLCSACLAFYVINIGRTMRTYLHFSCFIARSQWRDAMQVLSLFCNSYFNLIHFNFAPFRT